MRAYDDAGSPSQIMARCSVCVRACVRACVCLCVYNKDQVNIIMCMDVYTCVRLCQ